MSTSNAPHHRHPFPPMLLGIGCVVAGFLLNEVITIQSADADSTVREIEARAVAAEPPGMSPEIAATAVAVASSGVSEPAGALPPWALTPGPEPVQARDDSPTGAADAVAPADDAVVADADAATAEPAPDPVPGDANAFPETAEAIMDAAAEAAGTAGQPTDPGSLDTPELDYVASLKPSGEPVPEGLRTLEPGTLTRLTWQAGESLYGASIPTPVLVAEGVEPGPTLCVTAAVHGDELNGIETVRQLMYSINPEKLSGRVIGVPIVNLQAFERHSRYLPDRRDLNRFFPGNPTGSSASRIANSFFEKVIRQCTALVDLHTGSFHRTNLPQLRADLDRANVVQLTRGFGSTIILHSGGTDGTLRAAAVAAGIPAVTLEAGEPLRIDERAVKHSTKALFTLMNEMGMYNNRSFWGNTEPTYYSSRWVRANTGGMLISDAKLGRRVKAGDVLGSVVDPITNTRQTLVAPEDGRIIGMALNQFVIPGYAAFHIGIEAPSVEELENQERISDPELDHSVADVDEIEAGQDLSE